MKSEKILDAMGMLDERFLEESLREAPARKRISLGRGFRNLLAAVLTVALLGCAVWATTLPEAPAASWELYAEAGTLLDVMFGTQSVTPNEGEIYLANKLVGSVEENTAHYVQVQVPILSAASREPVSEELAALVEPYLIPVGETVVDPTGTITLEVMAYYYEPESECGAIYLQLTDPTGKFCDYVPTDPGILQTPGEEIEAPKGIGMVYLRIFEKLWGKAYATDWPSHLRFVESLSDETTWTFIAYFFCDNYDTVDLDIGFETEPMVDHRPYRIDIDLERTPTMETVVLGNAANKKSIHISPVGMRIGEGVVPEGSWIDEVVIHFKDGSTYVVVDQWERPSLITEDETCTYGYTMRINNHFAFANIIDVSEIYYVEINGNHFFNITW